MNRQNRPSTNDPEGSRDSAMPDRVVALPVYARSPQAASRKRSALTVWIAPMLRTRTAFVATLGTSRRLF